MYIRKLPSKRYQCVIRLKGHKLSKTFSQKSDAKSWGREQEYLIETSKLVRAPKNLTLRVLINEYSEHSLPNLKDSYGVNKQLKRLCNNYKWLVDKPYDVLKPIDFEKFKSIRLKDIGNHHAHKNNHTAEPAGMKLACQGKTTNGQKHKTSAVLLGKHAATCKNLDKAPRFCAFKS